MQFSTLNLKHTIQYISLSENLKQLKFNLKYQNKGEKEVEKMLKIISIINTKKLFQLHLVLFRD